MTREEQSAARPRVESRPAGPEFERRRGRWAEFRVGFFAPLFALGFLLGRPRMWKFTVLGGLLNTIVFAALAWWGVTHVDELTALIWQPPERAALEALWWALAVVLAIATVMLAFVLTVMLAAIVMAPFNDRLSGRVEEIFRGPAPTTPMGVGAAARDAAIGLSHEILNLVLYLVLMVPVVALHLIPAIGSIASAVTAFVATACMLALQFTDYPQSRRRFRWREKVSLLRRELPALFGLGVGIQFLLWIPIVNFMLIPVAVVAGTMVFCALDSAGRVPFSDRREPSRTASRTPPDTKPFD